MKTRRTIPLLFTLILSACASDPFLMEQDLEGIGGPLAVDLISFEPQSSGRFRQTEMQPERINTRIEVANVSDEDLTVKHIAVRQRSGTTAYNIEPSARGFDELIPEGTQHVFDMTLYGKTLRMLRPDESATIILTVVVTLTNGDSYHFGFEVEAPVPETAR